MITNGTTVGVDAFDDRLGFAGGEPFEAVGAIRFAGHTIPGARVVAAARTCES